MGWFNYYGLVAVAVILIPNIICAITDKNAYENSFDNLAVRNPIADIFVQRGYAKLVSAYRMRGFVCGGAYNHKY